MTSTAIRTIVAVLGPSDFEGWVQERGAYFPSSWDREHYQAVLALNDPGEAPLTGSLLIAPYGKGYFVYTGLAFFRQLPAGVPGAKTRDMMARDVIDRRMVETEPE